MKKTFAAALCAVTLVSSQLSADFLRVEMGGGVWNYKPSGDGSYENGTLRGTYISSQKEDSNPYFWMLIKHPVPIIPNLRLEYSDVKDSGIVNGTFKDFEVVSGTTTARYELKEYDIIPYYNILDNTMWTTIDLGIDIKVIDATYSADGVRIFNLGSIGNYHDQKTVALPLVYARGRVEVPGTGLGLEADGKYITYDGSTVYDFRAKVDYTFDFDVVKPGLEVGYRVQKFDLKTDDDKTRMNIDFAGFYAGLMLRF